MTLLTEVFGTAALMSTMIMYLTEIPLLKIMTKDRTTEGVQFSAILMNLINNILGLHYAILVSSDVLKLTHISGAALHVILCGAFFLVTRRRGPPAALSVGAAIFVVACHFYGVSLDVDYRASTAGLISSTVCTLAFATPVLSVLEARSTGNAELISLPATSGSLVCSVTWLTYGYLLSDIYIQIPNIPGIFVSLAAFFVVWDHNRRNSNIKKKSE